MAKVVDPYGLVWSMSTKIAELSHEEVVKGGKKWEEDHPLPTSNSSN